MSKSRQPKPPPSTAPSEETIERELPTPREPSEAALPAAYASEHELPQDQEQQQQYADDQQYYDENGQPYYDENGQPYYDENGVPYDPHYADEQHPDYVTAPMQHMPPMPMHPMHPLTQLRSHPPGVPMPAPPPSAGAPYRVPMPPVEPPAQVAWQPVPQVRPPRPILGSAIAVYGVLLWSFVVAGQFATSWITGAPLSQGTAAFLIFVATGTAWGFALQRSRFALPSVTMGRFIWRGIGIGAIAFLFFMVTIIAATIFGQSTHGHDFLIAFMLVAASMAAIIVGPRVTTTKRQERTHRMRFAVVSMWIVGAIITFVAGAELVTSG